MQGQGRAMKAWTQKHGPPWLSLASTYPTAATLTAAFGSLKLLPILVLPALRAAAYGRHTFCREWVYLAEEKGGRGHRCQAHRKMVANYAHCDKQGRSTGLEKAVCSEPEDMVSSGSA